jgi:hypothetical protein
MLAYIFWHRPGRRANVADYEDALGSFHDLLAGAALQGLLGSLSFEIDRAPWNAEPGWYEDWYLLDGFAALGTLREVAGHPRLSGRHQFLAARAGTSAGGVYESRVEPSHARAIRAVWFSKPRGMDYAGFLAAAGEPVGAGRDVWVRQLALGPAPEFVVHARDAGGLGGSPARGSAGWRARLRSLSWSPQPEEVVAVDVETQEVTRRLIVSTHGRDALAGALPADRH